MAAKYELGKIYRHAAVCLNHHIFVIGGITEFMEPKFERVIWMYNFYTDQWKRYDMPHNDDAPPPLTAAYAVAIGADVFVFGGKNIRSYEETNDLWKLSKNPEGCFLWAKISTHCHSEKPSPRIGHTGWDFKDNLYIFGGYGPSLRGYLNEHGNFELDFGIGTITLGHNNQLLCFNTSNETWKNLKCSGSIPEPRTAHASTRLAEKVWLFGGKTVYTYFSSLFEFDMKTLVWTKIQNTNISRAHCTFSVITGGQLLLHGGVNENRNVLADAYVLDLPSQTWREHANKARRCGHTCTTGITGGSCVIIGGSSSPYKLEGCNGYTTISHINLEPISLQQQACRVIYKHHDKLPWKDLPQKLISLLELE